ncbi:unnamed protein product [Zymoseptoria tritici ST99CH_1A5]|uniref:Peptidase M14 carboxypeptidase A domain-containing protein n=1 Tax=Zymoseptoria tritici ST99CH_1A5 TaxID=1276529 RepID=A0A1Y6M1A9_ZYMTR|nr:unnamed protein product [Zymoseptoria tritici ST99CH_1A5]
MALLGKLDAYQTWTASLLSKMDILVLPRYNVDGVHYFQRTLANNLDGNREAIKFDRQQSRTIRQRFIDYSPHIAVDLHEFTAPTIYGGDFQHAADALIRRQVFASFRFPATWFLSNSVSPNDGPVQSERHLPRLKCSYQHCLNAC